MSRGAGAGRSKDGVDTTDALYTSDVFRMYCYKVLPCTKSYNHNWKVCPFAHEGEKARRRDPRAVRYVGIECPDSKSGRECPRGETCPFAHNVFEYWLHPTRYRTQLCNEPATCRRKVCFFAHSLEELRKPSLEEFAAAPSVRESEEKHDEQVVGRPAGALAAATKAQEALALQQRQQQADVGIRLQAPSPYDQEDLAHRQIALQAGETSLAPAPIPTQLDEALKELATWFIQKNGSPTAGPPQAHKPNQTVQLLMMLQELIKTQQGEPPSGTHGSGPQQHPLISNLSRLSVDGIACQLQGQLGLGTQMPGPSVRMPRGEAGPGQSRAVHAMETPEGQDPQWDIDRSELQRRLSLDGRHWGRQY